MRESFFKYLAAAGAAIYSHCDAQYQELPFFVQAVMCQHKKAALYVLEKALDVTLAVIETTETLQRRPPSATLNYGKQALTALPDFLAYCKTDPKAPRIYYISKRLIVDDFLPVFSAAYIYYLMQYFYRSNKEIIPESIRFLFEIPGLFFSSALFIFSLSRKLQFYARTAVLSFEFPRAFHGMPNTFSVDNACCESSCNALRFITGDIRSVLLYQARLVALATLGFFVDLVRVPVLSPMLSWFLFAYQIPFAGQMIAEYRYASANVCERHRWENYKEHFEMFLSLGLLHRLGTSGLALLASQLTMWVSMKLESYIGNIFLLTPMLQVFANLPSASYETFLGGILMFYLIGLTYYMPFPKTVKETERSSLDLLRFWIEVQMDGTASKTKKILKDETSGHSSFRKWLKWAQEWIVWTCKKIQNSPLVMSFIHHPYVKAWVHFTLPTMLRSKMGALTDPVLVLYTPRMFAEIKNTLTSISSFHPILLKVVGIAQELDSIFSRSSVKWTLKGLSFFIPKVGFILPALGEILTADFIMNKAPKYLSDVLSICNWLHEKGIVNDEIYDKHIRKIRGFEKDIHLLRKVLGELPKSVLDDFLAWIGTEECRVWIAKSMVTLNALNDELTAGNKKKLKELGFESIDYDQVEAVEYDMPTEASVRRLSVEAVARINKADSCLFPRDRATQSALAVTANLVTAALPSATVPQHASAEDWDGCNDCDDDVACDSDGEDVVVSNHRLPDPDDTSDEDSVVVSTDRFWAANASLREERVQTKQSAWSARVFGSKKPDGPGAEQPLSKTMRNFSLTPAL